MVPVLRVLDAGESLGSTQSKTVSLPVVAAGDLAPDVAALGERLATDRQELLERGERLKASISDRRLLESLKDVAR